MNKKTEKLTGAPRRTPEDGLLNWLRAFFRALALRLGFKRSPVPSPETSLPPWGLTAADLTDLNNYLGAQGLVFKMRPFTQHDAQLEVDRLKLAHKLQNAINKKVNQFRCRK